MLSDLSSRVMTTDANSGHYGPPDETEARSCLRSANYGCEYMGTAVDAEVPRDVG
jgi:hypothetical protein